MMAQDGIRVLVVEDDYLVGEMIQGLLQDIGLVLAGVAAHGREGIEMARLLKPDVILMDIAMPGIDGIEATRQIQEICPTPVVALTAFESNDLVERASAAGVGAYLVKPANAQELERAITIAMARFQDMMYLRRLQAELLACQQTNEAVAAHLRRVQALLPVCAACRKTRSDTEYLNQVQDYVKGHLSELLNVTRCLDCGPGPRPRV
jgi:AmiR/NasT family two-component response regulator